VQCNKRYHKKTTMQDVDTQHEMLRRKIRKSMELVAKALTVGGVRAFSVEKHRVTPRDLWLVMPFIRRGPA